MAAPQKACFPYGGRQNLAFGCIGCYTLCASHFLCHFCFCHFWAKYCSSCYAAAVAAAAATTGLTPPPLQTQTWSTSAETLRKSCALGAHMNFDTSVQVIKIHENTTKRHTKTLRTKGVKIWDRAASAAAPSATVAIAVILAFAAATALATIAPLDADRCCRPWMVRPLGPPNLPLLPITKSLHPESLTEVLPINFDTSPCLQRN